MPSCRVILKKLVRDKRITIDEYDKLLRNLKPQIDKEDAIAYLHQIRWLQMHDKEIYEQGIAWHPYPNEKPNVPNTKVASFGEYYTAYEFLVTQKLGGVSHVITSVYFNGEFRDNDVIAWAELPEPYEEVEE